MNIPCTTCALTALDSPNVFGCQQATGLSLKETKFLIRPMGEGLWVNLK